MVTFYLLPPRKCLEQAVSDLFAKLLPGLPLPADAWDAMAGQLAALGGWADSVFLVPRDELPDSEPNAALAECYGAEPGDRVVDVSLSRAARSWVVTQADVSGAATAR